MKVNQGTISESVYNTMLGVLKTLFIVWCVHWLLTDRVLASHSMGLDLTYECLGGDTFALQLTFYRDCDGVAAPTNPDITISSVSCAQNFVVSLTQVSVRELNAVCASLQTTCSGGTYPGIEEYVYRDTIVLPDTCDDWIFSNAVCCRNNAINTISPTNVDIYVETTLDNLNTPCNNSPVFTNTPVPFMCLNAPFCFNNGAVDPDGDSLVYTLITPTIGPLPGDTVNYLAGYSPANPVTSSPPLTFDLLTGDICITPTAVGEVSVMQVRIEEWRNGVQIGYIDRDIQLRVIDCIVPNTLPVVDGINGTGVFAASICAGDTFCFFTNSVDPDTGQNVTMTWNGAISTATFDTTSGPRPVGSFCWLPDTSDISFTPHCFTVNVIDDNCPFLGTQTFSFCITVFGFMSTSATVQDASCPGICDGQSTVSISGGVPPYAYLWNDPMTQTNATATNLCAQGYSVTVTDSVGCTPSIAVTIAEPAPIIVDVDSVNVTCNGGSDGQATATTTGGTGSYTYLWDVGAGSQTTSVATGLAAGTYLLTVTDGNGCDTNATVTLLNPAVFSAVITDSANASCLGASDGTASITPMGGVTPYIYLWDVSAGSQTDSTATGLAAGSYSVTATDASGCAVNATVSLTEPTALAASLDSSTNVACFGGSDGAASVAATGGTAPYAYFWNPPLSQTGSSVSNIPAGIYSVLISDSAACDTTIFVIITEPPLSIAVISDSTDVNCQGGADGTATASGNGGVAPYTYQWDDLMNQTNSMAIGLSIGLYAVMMTDANGCTASTTVTINEPVSSISLSTTVGNVSCNGGADGQITVTATGGTSPYTYLWNDPAMQTDSTATGLYAGVYSVTVTDNLGDCIVDTTATVIDPATPINLTSTTMDVNCFGDSTGTATATPGGGTPPYTYIWDDPSVQTTSIATGLVAGSYSVTVTDNTGNCEIDTGVVVNEPSAALAATMAVVNIDCFGNSNGLATALSNGGTAPYTYQWDGGAGSQTDSSATGLSAGTYSVTISDANGCQYLDTNVVITQPVSPLSIIGSSTDVSCKGGADGTAIANTTGGTAPYTYLWDPAAGGQTSQAATGLVTGTYNVTVTDSNGCNISNIVLVNEPALDLTHTTAVAHALCYGDMTATATVTPTGGVPAYTYLWDPATASQTTQTATGLGAGTYSVTIADSYGCTVEDTTLTISEPDSLNLDSLTLFSNDICIGESTQIHALYPGADSSFTIIWDNGLGAGLGPFTVSPTGTTTYTIAVGDACGNTIDKSTTVTVSQYPIISLDPNIATGCVPLTVDFENQTPNASDSLYTWSMGNGDTVTGGMPTYTFNSSGTYTITVVLTNTSNCTTTSSGQNEVVVNPLPTATCTADPAQTDIRTPVIYFSGGVDDLSYAWGFGDGDSSYAQNPAHTYPGVGSYDVTLNVVDSNNCQNSCDLTIIIDPYYDIVIPNAFTPNPNGPGTGAYDIEALDNDVFFGLTDYVEEYHMMIFNRWGELIFETFDILIGWDGYYRGKLSQQDVYAWKINVRYIDGKEIERLGDVTLIR